MKFELLIDKLKQLNLPPDQYAVISSGVLAVRGIRAANDLDLVVTDSLWKQLTQKYQQEKTKHRPVIRPDPDIEILGPAYDPDHDLFESDRLVRQAELIDNIPYIPLETTKLIKQKMGRAKDLRDIKLINQYQKNHS